MSNERAYEVDGAPDAKEARPERAHLRHGELIAGLSLVEKCALLSGGGTFRTRGLPKRGIPEAWLSDGPHGLRKQAGAADHLGLNPSEPATCFPTACTVANSWDPDLARELGHALGEEAVVQGVSVVLGPGLNIKRNPLCGRNFEYFSEDPHLAGAMAAAYVRGIQGTGVAACPKHLAANSQETRRMASDSAVDERTLRELYLRGFETVVREGRPRAIMSSYNRINGTYANEDEWLLGEVLRREWGFGGAVVTDWGGSNDHVAGVRAGSTLEMPAPGADSVLALERAVRLGELAEDVVDARVDELLELVLSADKTLRSAAGGYDADAHHKLARKMAAQSVVLLKNADDLLPLAPGTRVAVVGDFANNPRFQGAGSSAVNATRSESILQLLGETELECVGYERGFVRNGEACGELVARAVELAKKADVVLFCLGLSEAQESEGADRADMRLNENQLEALTAVSAANPNVVAVLFAGSVVESSWRTSCKALLLAGLGGQAGAGAVLDVLCGNVCPSGKLAESWPERYEDVPSCDIWPGKGRTAQYREGIYVGYRYYQTAGVPVAFPFGFGLSYTSFAYADPLMGQLGAAGLPREVTLTVTNTGKAPGAEVVQLYASKVAGWQVGSGVFRPEQELIGFVKVELGPGQSKRVAVPLCEHALAYWNVKTGAWEYEAGTYELRLAAASDDVRLTLALELEGTGAPNPYEGLGLGSYETGKVAGVGEDEFAALLGRKPPASGSRIDRNMTVGELGRGRSPLGWLACAVLRRMLRASERRGESDLNLLFAYNMPLRGIAKLAGGMVSMGMVDAIVLEVRGFWLVGILRLLVEAARNAVNNVRLERRLAAAGEDSLRVASGDGGVRPAGDGGLRAAGAGEALAAAGDAARPDGDGGVHVASAGEARGVDAGVLCAGDSRVAAYSACAADMGDARAAAAKSQGFEGEEAADGSN